MQDAICGETYRSLVTVERGSLAGVLVSQVVADEVQMMMLATAESFRRRGVATALIQSLMQACGYVSHVDVARCRIDNNQIYITAFRTRALSACRSTHQYLLEVSDTNAPALDLYQKLGFEVYGTRRKYYADGNDAILLMLPACSSSGLDDI